MFRVAAGTVLRWQAEATAAPDREHVGSLVKPVLLVRRFADIVRHVVHSLTLAGFPGDGSVAAHLARVGWRLDTRHHRDPGLLRLFSFKLAVVSDVFSRAPLAAAVFLSEPEGAALAKLLCSAARRFQAPRHLVTDRGSQFTSQPFTDLVRSLGVRQRFGAIGKTGSIALIERFFRTLKDTGAVRTKPPLLMEDLARRLDLALAYCVIR